MRDYLCILGLTMYRSAEPRDGAPMLQVQAESPNDAARLARQVFGSFTDPVFVIPEHRIDDQPDRRGLSGVTVIRGPTP